MKEKVTIIGLGICIMLMFAGLYDWQETAENNRQMALEQRQIEQAIALQESIESALYIGNKNSRKFHTLDCSYLPFLENRVYFAVRVDAIDAGYDPCEKCNP